MNDPMGRTVMTPQLEILREGLARLLASGADPANPMVQGLRWQIALHERRERREAEGGYFDADGKIKRQHQNPID